MNGAERFRPILVILVWFLLMQILVLYYNAITGTFTFEFYLILLLTLVNIGVIVFLIRAAAKEFKKEYEEWRSLQQGEEQSS